MQTMARGQHMHADIGVAVLELSVDQQRIARFAALVVFSRRHQDWQAGHRWESCFRSRRQGAHQNCARYDIRSGAQDRGGHDGAVGEANEDRQLFQYVLFARFRNETAEQVRLLAEITIVETAIGIAAEEGEAVFPFHTAAQGHVGPLRRNVVRKGNEIHLASAAAMQQKKRR